MSGKFGPKNRGRWSVRKSIRKDDNEAGYRHMANQIAYKKGTVLTNEGNQVWEDGILIANDSRPWYKAWYYLEHGDECPYGTRYELR